MSSLAILKLRHATECMNHVQKRFSGSVELFNIEDVSQRTRETKEFTALHDQKWFELKQRHLEEMSVLQNFEMQSL